MRQVSKDEFKRVYLELGGGAETGWTADYWDRCIEPRVDAATRFVVEEPPSPAHTRMMIVASATEQRLFFMTDESEESFFDGLDGRDGR